MKEEAEQRRRLRYQKVRKLKKKRGDTELPKKEIPGPSDGSDALIKTWR